MQAQRTGVNGAHVRSITITREHRDAIYRTAQKVIQAGSELASAATVVGEHQADRDWIIGYREGVRQLARELTVASRLLDQVGWLEHNSRDTHELKVDEDLRWFILRMDPQAVELHPSTADEWWRAELGGREAVAR